jgi:subtilase family serine protease
MTIKNLAKAFSEEQYEKIYPFIADDAEWTVIGEEQFVGKKEIVEYCGQAAQNSKSVTIDFRISNTIADENKVVVNGIAELLKDAIYTNLMRKVILDKSLLTALNQNTHILHKSVSSLML